MEKDIFTAVLRYNGSEIDGTPFYSDMRFILNRNSLEETLKMCKDFMYEAFRQYGENYIYQIEVWHFVSSAAALSKEENLYRKLVNYYHGAHYNVNLKGDIIDAHFCNRGGEFDYWSDFDRKQHKELQKGVICNVYKNTKNFSKKWCGVGVIDEKTSLAWELAGENDITRSLYSLTGYFDTDGSEKDLNYITAHSSELEPINLEDIQFNGIRHLIKLVQKYVNYIENVPDEALDEFPRGFYAEMLDLHSGFDIDKYQRMKSILDAARVKKG